MSSRPRSNNPRLTVAQLTLERHTHATGSEDNNLRLSERRAAAVVVTYRAGRGVARERQRAAGFSEQRLLPAFALGDDRPRRVEIRAHV